jgi:ribonucleoside-diphosphate reductase alpha chain
MYYLRTKAAVDAIKFTLNNDKKLSLEVKAQPIQERLEAIAVLNEPAEMNADEYRAMIELAKNAGPEECEMCGSLNTKPRHNTVVKVLIKNRSPNI